MDCPTPPLRASACAASSPFPHGSGIATGKSREVSTGPAIAARYALRVQISAFIDFDVLHYPSCFPSPNLIVCWMIGTAASAPTRDNISPSDCRHSRTSRNATIEARWSPSDSVLARSSQALRWTRRISSSRLSPSCSSRLSLAFTITSETWSLWRSNPAGDIETRFAMFRNGSPATRAFSISPRSGLEHAKQVRGKKFTSSVSLRCFCTR
jgi:hypothetical protein